VTDVSRAENSDRSLTDYIYEIHEMAGHNPFLRQILEKALYENLPDDARKKLNDTTKKNYISLLDKKNWKCGHLGCEVKSCLSHEVSDSVFISKMKDNNGKVYILKPNLKTNPLIDEFSEIYPNSATTYPGYCSYHDRELFKDIDSEKCEKNVFYNKQSLRTLHRENFEVKLKILMAQSIVKEMQETIELEEYFSENIIYLNRKIELYKLKLERMDNIYNIIYFGIINDDYKIKYLEFDIQKIGYIFSSFLNLTNYNSDNEECFVFLYKINFENSPKFAVCYLDNISSKNAAIELHEAIKKSIMGDILHSKRRRFVFSADFINELSDLSKEILERDAEIFPIGPIEQIWLASEFMD